MARKDDAKAAALAASGTLNSDPQKVTDPAFTACGFFDPADPPAGEVRDGAAGRGGGRAGVRGGQGVRVRRDSVYNARAALAAGGLAALIPDKPGPKGGHKLTGRYWTTCRPCSSWIPG